MAQGGKFKGEQWLFPFPPQTILDKSHMSSILENLNSYFAQEIIAEAPEKNFLTCGHEMFLY